MTERNKETKKRNTHKNKVRKKNVKNTRRKPNETKYKHNDRIDRNKRRNQ